MTDFHRLLLLEKYHLTRASVAYDVRTGLNPVGALKRVIRFKSCEKPNDQPVYLTVPVGLLAILLPSVKNIRFDVALTSGSAYQGTGDFSIYLF